MPVVTIKNTAGSYREIDDIDDNTTWLQKARQKVQKIGSKKKGGMSRSEKAEKTESEEG